MRFVITLDANSFIGSYFLNIGHDGANAGQPTIDCAEIDLTHHYFVKALRGPIGPSGKHQSLYIPYSSVLAMHEYAKQEGAPFGFAGAAR